MGNKGKADPDLIDLRRPTRIAPLNFTSRVVGALTEETELSWLHDPRMPDRNAEIDKLINAMRALVEESRRLAKRHEELMQEYDRLRRELESLRHLDSN